jgi:long-subunit acyl-CoA synthetase (AMP-forming)
MSVVIAPGELAQRAARVAAALQAMRPRVQVLGVLADNGADWVAVDRAAQRSGITLVPLPAFFTAAQLAHAVQVSRMDTLFCQEASAAQVLGFTPAGIPDGMPWHRRSVEPRDDAPRSSKITFTSGTTGAPKPVHLSAREQWRVARSLRDALVPLGLRRHLCLLPLAVLLENVAGVYAAEIAGAQCCVPPLAEVGMQGAASFDAAACLAAIERWEAESVILLPQMLAALTSALEAGAPIPRRLRFAAVGGARTAPAMLERARRAGLPAYEGYGLSECASVVTLNHPGADRPGSVGRPLAHALVRVEHGEIQVKRRGRWFSTGDLGRLDAEGFLYVEGRRKNVLITSFGRNVSPEWPEAELISGPAIAQAAVFGESRAHLCAVLVAASAALPDATLERQVDAANARLPDYAQVRRWVRAQASFTSQNGLATANGRPRREAIWRTYGGRLDALL